MQKQEANRKNQLHSFFTNYSYGALHTNSTTQALCIPTISSTFGMVMPGRTMSSASYRYGFNGMEKDNEIKGAGNTYTTEFRQYDPRLGRFFSLDPAMRKYSSWSPYSFSFNNPIWWNDPTGADPCEGCENRAEVKIENITYNQDGSYSFTETIKVQEDILISSKVEKGTIIEERKLTTTETKLTQTYSKDGKLMNSYGESKKTESYYTDKLKNTEIGPIRMTSMTCETTKTTPITKSMNAQGIFGTVAQTALKNSGEFPIHSDAFYIGEIAPNFTMPSNNELSEGMKQIMIGSAMVYQSRKYELSNGLVFGNKPQSFIKQDYFVQMQELINATFSK